MENVKRTHVVKKSVIIKIGMLLVGLPLLLIVFIAIIMAGLLLAAFFRMALHLDFSQEYRKVQAAEQIRFRDNWNGKVYRRCVWGLKLVGRCEEDPEEEPPPVSWLDTSVYDVTASGELVAWYDWEEDAVFLGNADGEIQKKFDVMYHGEKVTFSPDENYLLFYEQQWNWSGSDMTDDEYCYYRVIDLEDGTQYTIYSAYREYWQVYWEED